MTFVAYNNNSEANAVPKSLINETMYTGRLRDECTIQDPVIMIESVAVPTFNYVYITEFGRYYFVTHINNYSTNLWEIYLHVDALESFWTSVKTNECIVGRNEIKRTADLKDDELWATADSLYSVYKFPNTPLSNVADRRFVLVLNGAGYGSA